MPDRPAIASTACTIHVRGVVQGVGFRPHVFRLATSLGLAGSVRNGVEGVEIHLEGSPGDLEEFKCRLEREPPPAARITAIDIAPARVLGIAGFTIDESDRREHPTVRISPDLPICDECLKELFDARDRRYLYPYINCTNCGPRYTVILGLPYDRPRTTMKGWPLDDYCAREYHDPSNRRFHAQPLACPECGPQYVLVVVQASSLQPGDKDEQAGRMPATQHTDAQAGCLHHNGRGVIERAAELLRAGCIVAVKGLGGYHLACDARNAATVAALRERKYRKEKPFAVMARDLGAARALVDLSPEAEDLLTSAARPIVLVPAVVDLAGVAPENHELGVMLPYTPVHHLLFATGAPDALVMTSANRSNEPIAYQDDDARVRLAGIADAFLIGQRPIARRVDDSVARAGAFGPVILRRARGYAPGAVATFPGGRPVLAVGADLKNTVTLVVDGQAFVSQHIGDLEDYPSAQAFRETIADLVSMYEVDWGDVLVACDAHPQYISAAYASELPAAERISVQHHRAHIASVLAEQGLWDKRVLGVSFDGTGYGDDGSIWGGEIFAGSVAAGFERVAHLRPAMLPGGDAAARWPVQAAAGFLAGVNLSHGLPDLSAAPFDFPERYRNATELVRKGVRTFTTTSAGRLFDAAAALLGFTRGVTFEGQAAAWLEHLATPAPAVDPYPFPFSGDELDYRPLLSGIMVDRLRRRDRSEIARAFQRGVAQGLTDAIQSLCRSHDLDTVVLSGGVFQNELLMRDLKSLLGSGSLEILTNHAVPPNDGGISLGQAAIAIFVSGQSSTIYDQRTTDNGPLTTDKCTNYPSP
jgi:hydrogenase maturation protein HypF